LEQELFVVFSFSSFAGSAASFSTPIFPH
jgi:hypothetical protein